MDLRDARRKRLCACDRSQPTADRSDRGNFFVGIIACFQTQEEEG